MEHARGRGEREEPRPCRHRLAWAARNDPHSPRAQAGSVDGSNGYTTEQFSRGTRASWRAGLPPAPGRRCAGSKVCTCMRGRALRSGAVGPFLAPPALPLTAAYRYKHPRTARRAAQVARATASLRAHRRWPRPGGRAARSPRRSGRRLQISGDHAGEPGCQGGKSRPMRCGRSAAPLVPRNGKRGKRWTDHGQARRDQPAWRSHRGPEKLSTM
jgi:hypothetical protein